MDFKKTMDKLKSLFKKELSADKDNDNEAVHSLQRQASKLALEFCSNWRTAHKHTVALMALKFYKPRKKDE